MAHSLETNIEIKFVDPYKGQGLTLTIASVEDLAVISYQRRPSESHLEKLRNSIEKLGFLIPLTVINHPKDSGKYIIIDGQHRFLAAKQLGIPKLPVIIVPEYLAEQLMNLNTERELNIREKSYVSLSIYRDFINKSPDLFEDNNKIIDAIENAYYITLGLSYESADKTNIDLSGSAFEPILKHCDTFLNKILKEAQVIREERSSSLIKANNILQNIVNRLRESGDYHPYIQTQILGWANPYKGRKTMAEFSELFSKLLDKLEIALSDPKKVLNSSYDSG